MKQTKSFARLLVALFAALTPSATFADSKISAMTNGGTVQTTDQIPAVRSGANVRVVVGSAATQPSSAFLQGTNNFSDLSSPAAARTNLGLGSAATQPSTAFLNAANNLNDLPSATISLTNLLPSQTGQSGKVLGTNGTVASWVSSGGTGTVTTSGTPATGNLTKFSGSNAITNADLSGDCTTSGTLAVTCTKTGGVSFGTAATQNAAAFLQPSNNLSDLGNTSTARTNLGLGTAATQAIAAFLQPSNNLSDIASASTARTNLGLGTAATQAATAFAQSITLNTPSLLYSSPINFTNTSGSFAGSLSLLSQTANTVLAGPTSGAAAAPTMRALVAADIPTLNQNTTGQAGTVATINGLISAGTNVTITGAGTSASPYSIAASGTGGGISSVTSASNNLTSNTVSGAVTLSLSDAINAQGTAASYTVLSSDIGKIITHAKSTAVADTLAQAGSTGFEAGKTFCEVNLGAGTVTITPTLSTVNGNSSLALATGQSGCLTSDGTNYVALLGAASTTGSGTVTNVSVASANGFAGTVASSTTTPALTLSTTVTGLLKGNGTAVSAATSGTDYQAPITLTTTGTSGAATLSGGTLNIPQYSGGGGSGTVTTTGSPASGNLTKFSGSTSITNADLSGDCTTSGTLAVTCTKTSGSAFAASATTDTTSASNISAGTLNTARLPSPFTSGTASGSTSKFVTATGTLTSGHCGQWDASGNIVDSGAACGSGGGSGTGGPVIQPLSYYTADTAGNLFPYVYSGGGGNASSHDAGWGVAASLAADATLELRFQMPSTIPGGTFKLVSYCLANASTGTAKYTVSDANVASGSSPSAATLSAETQTSLTWSAADQYVVTKTALTSTPVADNVSVVAVAFNHTGWTLASIMSCRWVELWE